MSFRAIRLLAPDYRECLRFYIDFLGVEPHWGNENTVIADFELASSRLAVCDSTAADHSARAPKGISANQTQGGQPATLAQDKAVLVFRVDNLDAACSRLREKGVVLELEPTDFPDLHVRAARFRDPAGNLIEVNVRLS